MHRHFRLKFGEIAKEMTEDSADYDGWISRGWIQEEFIHVDVLPAELKLPRRYAFRYMEIEVIDTSLKWQMVVEDVSCVSVSAVSMEDVKPVESEDEMIRKLDRVSLRTLQNCMQSVFEDGPKRDRRLWLGDLRLQALANYETFHNMDLVKDVCICSLDRQRIMARSAPAFSQNRNLSWMIPSFWIIPCSLEQPSVTTTKRPVTGKL